MISRRGFLGALAGLIAAPSLIEKLKPASGWRIRKVAGDVEFSGRYLRSRKVYTGEFYVSPEVIAKLHAEEGAFIRHAQAMLNDISANRLEELHRMYGA